MRKSLLVLVVVCSFMQGCFHWKAPERQQRYTSIEDAVAEKDQVRYLSLTGGTGFPANLGQFPELVKLQLRLL